MDKIKQNEVQLKLLLLVFLVIAVKQIKPLSINAISSGFNVRTKLPTNQINNKVAYFHINSDEGLSQYLQVEVENISGNEIVVHMEPLPAATDSNGTINFSKESAVKNRVNSSFDFVSMINIEDNDIRIPAYSTRILQVKLDSPNLGEGELVMGSINFKNQSKDTNKSGFKNLFEYNVVVVLSGNNEELTSGDFLEYHGLEIKKIDSEVQLDSIFFNREMMLIDDLEISVAVSDSHGNPVLTRHEKNMQMAPESSLSFIVPQNEQKLKEGVPYEVNIKARSFDKQWMWNEKFHIKDGKLVKENNHELLAIIILGVISFFALRKLYKKKHN